jgi:superfamily II DNA helicase RecQ
MPPKVDLFMDPGRYNLLHTNAIKTPFRPLERLESLNTYVHTLAHFSAYILRAVLDRTEEPVALLLPSQVVEAAHALSRVLEEKAKIKSISEALRSIHRLPRNDSLLYREGVLGVEKIDNVLQSHIEEGRNALHSFLWNVVLHPSGQGPETPNLSLPVSRFIALSSYDAMTKTFRRAGKMTMMMAHLQWGFRSVAFFEFHRQCTELPLPRTPDIVDQILHEIHDMVLVADSATPFGALHSQLVYAEALQAGAMEVATTMWSPTTQTAHYNGIPLPFAKLKDLAHVTLQRAKSILFERLVFGMLTTESIRRPAVVYDNVRDSRSYLDSRVNPGFYQDLSLHDTILQEPSLRSRFLLEFAADGMHIWNGDEVYKYFILIKDFLYDLATLVYLLSGQVPRGPELLSLRWQSSPFAFRSLFALQGHLMIYQEYAKQDGITGKATRILRMPPQPVSTLIEVYLVYVRPLEHFLWKKFLVGLSEPKVGAESLLFAPFGQPIPAQALSNYLRRITSAAMGPKARGIGFRGLRQVTTLFANYMLPQEVKTAPLVPSALAAQSGHSDRTAQVHYDNHVDFVLGEINTARCETFRLLSLHWHRLFGFEHPDVTIALSEVSVKADALVRADLHEMSSSIAQRVAPMLSSQLSQTVEEIMITLRATEYTQHHNPPVTIGPFLPVRASTVQLLRRLLRDEEVQWRSQEQALAVEHAIRGDPIHLIAVMPTGLGKSLLYQIPALHEEKSLDPKYTVLLVPLRSLLQSSVASCGRFGLAVHAVDSGMAWRDPTERLIVSTYDSLAHNSRLQSWLLAYGSQRRIGRIVVDEAHSILSDNQFRSGFTLLMSILLRCTAPLVFMTGTLPISLQDELLREIKGASSVCLIRVPTDRPNIAYNVLPKPLNMNMFCAHVRRTIIPTLVQYPERRVIIFCRYVADCESLSEQLGAFLYHGKASATSKEAALGIWLQRVPLDTPSKVCVDTCYGIEVYADMESPLQCIMVATSALSMGIDHPHVYHVLFYREPFTLIDYIQQAGRAGRDNKHRAIVEINPSQGLKDVEPELLEFIQTLGCRRNVLQKHMDDIPSSCHGIPNAELCDRCRFSEEDPPLMLSSTSLEHSVTASLPLAVDNQQREQQALVVEAIYDTIVYLQHRCVRCTLSYNARPSAPCDCPPTSKKDIELLDQVISQARRGKPFPGLHTCIYCRMPQMKTIRDTMDRHMSVFGVNGDQICSGRDFIISTLYVALALQKLPPLILHELGLHPEHLGEILWRPVIEPPFDRFDIWRQILYLHLILPGTISHVTDRPASVSALIAEPWYQSWIPDLNPSTDDRVKYSMCDILILPAQIEAIKNDNRDAAPTSNRTRHSLRLPAINLVKAQDQHG